MSEINKEIIIKIEKNSKEKYISGLEIILKLLDNVIKDPTNQKYRIIRLENKIIKEKIVDVDGMMEVLLEIGFVEANSMLSLPNLVLMAKIKKYREFLAERLQIIIQGGGTQPKVKKIQEASSSETGTQKERKIRVLRPQPARPYLERIKFPNVLATDLLFLRTIEHFSDTFMQYDDIGLINYGKSIIPIEKLKLRALEKLRSIQKAILAKTYNEPEPCTKDLILVELLNWFNTEFFEWINGLSCKVCKKELKMARRTRESEVHVEHYSCCNTPLKFYRYNDVADLLVTRRGRCGEYANCFTFLCKCLNYDVRYVSSTFDHVWTEVYSIAQKRWIHVDPSENVIDSPLMYQHGWKRDVDYVLAYSEYDVQDVTWRYTNNHKKTSSVRQTCSEMQLIRTLIKLREKRQANLSLQKKKYLLKRTLIELIELTVEREPTENERKGRSSGSLSWRESRGEQNQQNFYVFEATETDLEKKQFNLRFSCAENYYEKFFINKNKEIEINETFKGWNNYYYKAKNIFRKIERDWKMVYLARTEGADNAEISWKFDFKKFNLKIAKLNLKFDTKTYEDAKIDVKINPDSDSETVVGSSGFTIVVKMNGGKGDIAWQHTQLFRQNVESVDYPFEINISFD